MYMYRPYGISYSSYIILCDITLCSVTPHPILVFVNEIILDLVRLYHIIPYIYINVI